MLKKKSDQLSALRNVALFSSMSDRDLKAVLAGCREEVYSDGQAIVREGTPGGPFFLIVEGQGKLMVNGKQRKLFGPGDYFGEIAMIDKGPRTATIIAKGNVKALAISSWDFLALCEQDFNIAKKVMTGMASVIRTLDKNAGT
jgi:CRP-like cAMP-binding protein